MGTTYSNGEMGQIVRDIEHRGEEFTIEVREVPQDDYVMAMYACQHSTGDIFCVDITVKDFIDYLMENDNNEN